ncbi:MAG: lipid A deacylase LpxR family protein [Alphaproteobacteria bacterium]
MAPAPAGAGWAPEGTATFIWENDFFAGTDRNYSNGVKLAFFSKPIPLEGAVGFVAQNILVAKPEDTIHYGFALGHSIFTPEDRLATEPLPDQHPYAGFLYGEYSVLVNRSGRTEGTALDTVNVQIGLVGPAAGGEAVQNTFHRIIDDDELLGWDNQLGNEIAFAISYERKFRARKLLNVAGLEVDVIPNVGASLGTLLTQVSGGATFRIGTDLQDDYGPPRVRPSLAGSAFFDPADRFSWYLFAGGQQRAVGRNLFLDGNTFRDSLSVDRNVLVSEVQAGAVVQIQRVQFAYTFVARTQEFATQGEPQRFGAASISVKF